MQRDNEHNQNSASQTQFAEQELLYESASLPEAPVEEQPVEEKKHFLQQLTLVQRIVVAVVSAGFVMTILTVLVVIMSSTRTPTAQPVATPSPSPHTRDAFSQRIIELRENISQSDPTVDQYPPPPVDFNITLE